MSMIQLAAACEELQHLSHLPYVTRRSIGRCLLLKIRNDYLILSYLLYENSNALEEIMHFMFIAFSLRDFIYLALRYFGELYFQLLFFLRLTFFIHSNVHSLIQLVIRNFTIQLKNGYSGKIFNRFKIKIICLFDHHFIFYLNVQR